MLRNLCGFVFGAMMGLMMGAFSVLIVLGFVFNEGEAMVWGGTGLMSLSLLALATTKKKAA